MNSANAAFLLSLITNGAISMTLVARIRRSVVDAELSEKSAKSRFTWLCVAVSFFSGIVVLLGVVALFRLSVGHGELLITGPLAHALLCGPTIVVGRIIIGWEPLRW